MTWPAITGVMQGPDGNLYVLGRCNQNSCAGRTEPAVLVYNSSGNGLARLKPCAGSSSTASPSVSETPQVVLAKGMAHLGLQSVDEQCGSCFSLSSSRVRTGFFSNLLNCTMPRQ